MPAEIRPSHARLILCMQRLIESSRGCIHVLQVGACDGKRFDPLYNFILQHEGITGLFVEPIKEYYDLLLENYKHLKGAKFLNVAVSNFTGTTEIRLVDPKAVIDGAVPPWAVGISTMETLRNAIDGVMISSENFELIKAHTLTRMINVVDINEVIQRNDAFEYDVFLSDCEGHDYTILKAMDLTQFRPSVIFAESMLMSENEYNELFLKLSSFGYKVASDDADMVAYFE